MGNEPLNLKKVADFTNIRSMNDFGFSLMSEEEFVAKQALDNASSHLETLKETETTLRHKLNEVEVLVMPLLQKLVDTADIAIINWPNRKQIIQPMIDQLKALTRG